MIHPDDLAATYAALSNSTVTLQPIHHEFRIVTQGNKVRWLCGDTAPPAHEADRSVLWHGFLTDITQHKEAEQLQARLEAQLMQSHKMDSIGQLAGGVAHDFNNLLTIISGFANLCIDELPANSSQRTYLESVKSAAARGATLTQQLVAFARKKIVHPEQVDLNMILTQMTPMIRRLVGEHISVKLSLAEQPCVVKVDVGSMEQVLMNLIVNARDAMPGGGELSLRTRAILFVFDRELPHPDLHPGRYVVVSVMDNGIGMANEVRARLFEPFFTTKPQGSGTGLGLAMCHGIVHQAGGVIAVHSECNVGTTFDIYLPHQQTMQINKDQKAMAVQSHAGNETILIVEDEPMILQLVSRTLEKLGYRVLTANDGIEALEVTNNAEAKIDLLVTDVIMPRLGGRDLVNRMQQHHPQMKVLYMSGYAENALAHRGELPPGLNFIQKPYQPDELTVRIREILDRS